MKPDKLHARAAVEGQRLMICEVPFVPNEVLHGEEDKRNVAALDERRRRCGA